MPEVVVLRDSVKEDLFSGPERILMSGKKIVNLRAEVEAVEVAMQVATGNVTVSVANEPEFSNETKRKVEVAARLQKDKTYQTLLRRAQKLGQQLELAKLDYEYECNKFKAARSLALVLEPSTEE